MFDNKLVVSVGGADGVVVFSSVTDPRAQHTLAIDKKDPVFRRK